MAMSLLHKVAGAVVSKFSGDHDQAHLVEAAMRLFNDHGGLQGILDQFTENGMAEEVTSWVSTGENMPITAMQVQKAIGKPALNEIAQEFDLPAKEVAEKLAKYLPTVVDRLTPNGKVPRTQSGLLLHALSMLRKD
jgi:uncharacterized protein YidB (DUF937 family)